MDLSAIASSVPGKGNAARTTDFIQLALNAAASHPAKPAFERRL
jgi:hypothetical protein